jgi:hypothetical protein
MSAVIELTPTRVKQLYEECLQKSEDVDDPIFVDSVSGELVKFNLEALMGRRSEISGMLDQLTEELLLINGGEVLDKACYMRNRKRWVSATNRLAISQLIDMGRGIGRVMYMSPREDWGDPPYLNPVVGIC